MENKTDINLYLVGGQNIIVLTVLENEKDDVLKKLRSRENTTVMGTNGIEVHTSEVAAFQVVR